MKIFALLAAAVVLPITLSAPAPAQAQQNGHTYTNVNHDGDRYRPYRRGDARRYAYNYRWRDDRRGDDRRDYRKRDRRRPKLGHDHRKHDHGRRYSGRDYQWRPHGYQYGPPRRVDRHAYRAPQHRYHFHNHKRLSKRDIRRIALARYPSILRLEYGNGIYDVWARDRYGRSFRLGYDAFTGAFLTFFYLS